jgi:23S rRNA (uracil1939-C5)-methyltransferase
MKCDKFGLCGGCSLYDLTPQQQAEYKQDSVQAALALKGVEAKVNNTLNAHGAGRRRVTLHGKDGYVGFNAAKSHELIEIESCSLLEPNLNKSFEIAKKILRATKLEAADFHFTLADNGLDLSVKSDKALNEKLRAALLEANNGVTRLIYNESLITQQHPPFMVMSGVKINLQPQAFLQATQHSSELLIQEVLKRKGKAKRAVEFFSGLGTFTLPLAKFMSVDAFEMDEKAVAALQEGLRFAQGLKPVNAQTRDLFRRPLIPYELKNYDLALLDPPRSGAQKQCEEIAKSNINHVIMVSCNPETFARDVKILTQQGFALGEVIPLDQFAFSSHVEVITALKRKKDA